MPRRYEVDPQGPFIFADSDFSVITSFKQTDAELAAGVTPTNYVFKPVDLAEITRYNAGTVGNSTDDLAATNTAISVIKQSGGLGVIPSTFNSAMAKPALGFSNSQSGGLVDFRLDRPNSGNEAFGAIDWYVEGKDSGGNYATEFRVLGKQNPAFTVNSLSDGSANGYSRTNFSSSFLHKHGSVDQWQYLADPLFGGYYSWALIYFSGSSGKYALWTTIDNNSKPRFTMAPANLVASSGSVIGATNASPIVIQTSAAHLLAGTRSPVTIAAVGGNTAANGSWEVNVVDGTHFELIGSTGNAAYTSGGTFAGVINHGRATLNVPKIQGGNEAIVTEGQIASELLSIAPFIAQSKAVDVNFHARPYVVNNSGTQQVGASLGSGCAKHVIGSVALVAGAATINLSGDASFTSNGTYQVFLQPQAGGAAATPTKVNGGQFTIAGTGTDTIAYHAIGY